MNPSDVMIESGIRPMVTTWVLKINVEGSYK
jgi:hypothetical protein